jgi:PAS domain S-box-containing protein
MAEHDREREKLLEELAELRERLSRSERLDAELRLEVDALRKSEKRHRALLAAGPDPVVVYDRQGRVTLINEAFSNTYGWLPEELFGKPIDFVPEEERDATAEAWQKTLAGEPVILETKRLSKWGTVLDVQIRTAVLRDSDGNLSESIVIHQDVTERRRSERLLAESEKRFRRLYEETKKAEELYRSLLNSSADAIVIYDMEGNAQYVSPSFTRTFGWTLEELRGRRIPYVPDSEREASMALIRELMRVGASRGDFETRRRTKDGRILHVSISASRYHDHEGNPAGMLAILRDITERKRTEQEMMKVEKLESIGALAGGIAHDFNNLLTAILGNVSLAMVTLKSEGKSFELLAEAEKACLRARSLTQQLLAFAKGGAPITKVVSVRDLLGDSCKLPLTGTNVLCALSIPSDIWAVDVDPAQVGQVVGNLVLNARQAMPDGGTVTVKAENLVCNNDNGLGLSEGKYVKISVEDQGVGIPRKDLPRIFEPYFTTKPGGSGLGLATCYTILGNHDGAISVESTEGKGTVFRIFLPASSDPAEEEHRSRADLVAGKGRVLLMDDEDAVRKLGGELLGMLGYDFELARDGRECIDLYVRAKEASEPFDVVILDLTVRGGMGGLEAMRRLLEIDAGIKAIVSSGYSDDPVMANHREIGFRGVIPKPYQPSDLSRILNSVINPLEDPSSFQGS